MILKSTSVIVIIEQQITIFKKRNILDIQTIRVTIKFVNHQCSAVYW